MHAAEVKANFNSLVSYRAEKTTMVCSPSYPAAESFDRRNHFS